MLFQNIAVLQSDFSVAQNLFVGVRGDKIAYIGAERPAERFGEEYDGRGKLLMSGFFNTHSHAAMTLLRGYAENLPLAQWLSEKVFPFEARLDEQAVYWGSLLACAEMMRFGTVSFSDMYMFGDGMARAVLESGLKANICVSTVCFDGSSYFDLPSFHESVRLRERYHGAGEGRLLVDLCIHGEYTSTPKVVRELAGHAKEVCARIQLHLSETKTEHEECKARHGRTPAGYFLENGVFDVPVTAAHCVWVEDEDIAILARQGVFAAANPASNMKLASGFAPVPKLLEKGVCVTIGTDGAASSNNLNMWKDLYLFSLIYKGYYQTPQLVSPAEALRCATVNGALAQGREGCGSVAVGNRADLIAVDLDVPNMQPQTDMASNLCYAESGADVCLSMVDGRVLWQNGEYRTMDIEKIKFEAEAATRNILKQL
ncbi:MAG: amidohydrolase [Oscillospiraceae bacterium]|jgi:5-methylthioadenosine/S-adenosylhomocysteine deaminase|nr:amidohydrolase [Oscillospiraceae bacterium]